MHPDLTRALARTLAGDLDAYAEVVRACEDELRAFIARRCPDRIAVAEVAHDAFVVAYQRLARFDPAQGPFAGWLKGIARNLLLQHLDAATARMHRLDRFARLQFDRARALAPADDDRLADLRRCLDKLPAVKRELLDRRYRDGLEVRALAEALGRTATWVTTNLQRARDAVRDCMGGAAASP